MSGVNYQRPETARRYVKGRALPDSVLNRWGSAVAPHLPDRDGLSVLDLGAGTGIFARAWPTWLPCRVIAVEPAAAMRAQMAACGVPTSVRIVAARGEQLPTKSRSVDVVWMSAVIHHLEDLDRCAREIDRVLRSDGTVLIRGLFADLGTTPGLEFLPGSQRAVSAFPSVTMIEQAFERHELPLVSTETVEDTGPSTAPELAQRIRRLRTADTLLGQFTDPEIAEGLATIDAMAPTQVLPPARLGLITFRR